MQLITRSIGSRFSSFVVSATALGVCVLSGSAAVFAAPPTEHGPAGSGAGSSDDVLGELVIQASPEHAPVLPDIALEFDPEGLGVAEVFDALVRRDLDLSGQFHVVAKRHAAPEDGSFDGDAWRARGVEYVVRTHAEVLDDGRISLHLELYLPELGDVPAARLEETVAATAFRRGGHRLVDRVIGNLTGVDGPFDSRLLVVVREGTSRSLFTVDVDGYRLRRLSPREVTVVAATFGPGGVPYYAGAKRGEPIRIFRVGDGVPLTLNVAGSVYGLAYDPAQGDWAVSIAVGEQIQLFRGPNLDELTPATEVDFALAPTFGTDGMLVWTETRGRRTRVRSKARYYSSAAVPSTHATVCDSPDGAWVVFQSGQGKRVQLHRASLTGGKAETITQAPGTHAKPACSPDGRLVAHVSTQAGHGRPALWLTRVDGGRSRKITGLAVEEMHWSRW